MSRVLRLVLMAVPSILQYRLQKDQQMLKEAVDVLLIRSKFSTPTFFGVWLPSSGSHECLINYSSNLKLESSGSIPLCIDEITLHDPRHIVERIPSQHAKLRISTYIITSKSTRCKGHDNPSSINLILHISYSNSQFCE
jgi:hypothetical protein